MHEILVNGAALKLRHNQHIMAQIAKDSSDQKIAAFIQEETHRVGVLLRASGEQYFVSDGIRGVGYASADINFG